VHPTQLYETAAAIGFFFLLSWIYRKKRKAPGEVFLIMGMLYGGWRFLIEFIRGDERPQWLGELSYSQVVSIALFVISGVWLFLLRSRPQPVSAEPPPRRPRRPGRSSRRPVDERLTGFEATGPSGR